MIEIGNEGVAALICDSTNAMREGVSASEADVASHPGTVIREAPRRVAVTTFASNVARIRSVAEAARAAGRRLVVVGRAMNRVIEAAQRDRVPDRELDYAQETEFENICRRARWCCSAPEAKARPAPPWPASRG